MIGTAAPTFAPSAEAGRSGCVAPLCAVPTFLRIGGFNPPSPFYSGVEANRGCFPFLSRNFYLVPFYFCNFYLVLTSATGLMVILALAQRQGAQHQARVAIPRLG